jgi:hypothetical protein
MEARNRIVPARQATLASGIDSLESIPGHLKSQKIWALVKRKDLHAMGPVSGVSDTLDNASSSMGTLKGV